MKVKIEDVEYTINCLKPYHVPFAQKIAELIPKIPTDFKDAEETGKELNECLDKILEDVEPKPKEEHKLILFNVINTYTTAETNKAMKPFRESGVLKQLFRGESEGAK